MADDNLPEITPEMLEAVTGGSGTSDVTALLQSLMSSIKDIATSQQSSSSNQMMPMMMMMMMMHNQAPAAAPAPAAPPPEADGWIRVA